MGSARADSQLGSRDRHFDTLRRDVFRPYRAGIPDICACSSRLRVPASRPDSEVPGHNARSSRQSQTEPQRVGGSPGWPASSSRSRHQRRARCLDPTAWLKGKGIEGGRALSIGYFEALIEIYVGAGLALLAAFFALTRGAVVIGALIVVVATVLIVGYTVIFIVPALKGIKVPRLLFTISKYLIGGPRADDHSTSAQSSAP